MSYCKQCVTKHKLHEHLKTSNTKSNKSSRKQKQKNLLVCTKKTDTIVFKKQNRKFNYDIECPPISIKIHHPHCFHRALVGNVRPDGKIKCSDFCKWAICNPHTFHHWNCYENGTAKRNCSKPCKWAWAKVTQNQVNMPKIGHTNWQSIVENHNSMKNSMLFKQKI